MWPFSKFKKYEKTISLLQEEVFKLRENKRNADLQIVEIEGRLDVVLTALQNYVEASKISEKKSLIDTAGELLAKQNIPVKKVLMPEDMQPSPTIIPTSLQNRYANNYIRDVSNTTPARLTTKEVETRNHQHNDSSDFLVGTLAGALVGTTLSSSDKSLSSSGGDSGGGGSTSSWSSNYNNSSSSSSD